MNFKSKGFTLPEVIIATFLTAIVGGLILLIVVRSNGVFYTETAKVGQGLNVNDTLANIRSNVKVSAAVASSFTNGGTTYTSGSSTLVLKVPSVDSTGAIIPSTFDYIVYTKQVNRQTNMLVYKLFPATGSVKKSLDQVLAFNVNNLLFQYFDSSGAEASPTVAVKVRVTLTLEQSAGAANEMNIATTEAVLRND